MSNKKCEDYFRLCNYQNQKKEFEPPISGLVILKSQAAPEFRTCYPQASSSHGSGHDVYTFLWVASWQQVILAFLAFLCAFLALLIRIQLCSQGGGLSKNKLNWWRWILTPRGKGLQQALVKSESRFDGICASRTNDRKIFVQQIHRWILVVRVLWI